MQPRRQHLIDIAQQLFNQHSFHATGIDLILAESGVSKATLYKHFHSKNELILAVLAQRQEQVLTLITQHIEAARQRGACPTLAIFDALDKWFQDKTFFGCNFINASAEFGAKDDPIHILAANHKAKIQLLIQDTLESRGKSGAKQLAREIALLADGAIVVAHTRGDKKAAQLAKQIASRLLTF